MTTPKTDPAALRAWLLDYRELLAKLGEHEKAAKVTAALAAQPPAVSVDDAMVIYTAFDRNMEERLFHKRETAERHAVGGVRTWKLIDAGPHYRDSPRAALNPEAHHGRE